MVVLRAIGRFFKKIWDWIRQTAWIQPLLIVGVIFGIIFSIPSIVKAVKNNRVKKSTYAAYYHSFKLSLEGGENSEADKFTDDLYDVMSSAKTADEFRSAHGDLGDKFFIAYVEKNCDPCDKAKEGFKQFQDNYKKYVGDDGHSFHMVTIFADDETSETTEDETAFVQYLGRHVDFFSEVASRAYESFYYENGKLSGDTLDGLADANPEDIKSPTVFLVELGNEATERGFLPGVTEVMFGVGTEGADKFAKAELLRDCWTHSNDFSNKSTK